MGCGKTDLAESGESHFQSSPDHVQLRELRCVKSRSIIRLTNMAIVFVEELHFSLAISAVALNPPEGYLFICPSKDLQTGPCSFRWPVCPAYWSLDPLGVERLSEDDAMRLGFSSVQLNTEIFGKSWNAGVYIGLRQFHQANGFDPESQDVAVHLGEQLYQLCDEAKGLFAHGEL